VEAAHPVHTVSGSQIARPTFPQIANRQSQIPNCYPLPPAQEALLPVTRRYKIPIRHLGTPGSDLVLPFPYSGYFAVVPPCCLSGRRAAPKERLPKNAITRDYPGISGIKRLAAESPTG
jgi:hypothetical protein